MSDEEITVGLARITRQPIETAPRDGTPILAYGRYKWGGDNTMPDFSRGQLGWAVVRFAKDEWRDEDEPRGRGVWELVHDNPYEDWMDAIYWTPLPEAPR